MVEAIANGIEDRLIDGLSFKLAPGASYITDRRSVSFYPQGSNIYSSVAGTKLIRIVLTGDSWLDPSTFRLMFDVVNNDTNANHNLRPLLAPWAFFRRMRILAGGQLVEDIDYYNRVHQMFSALIARESNTNNLAESFGYTTTEARDLNSTATFAGIPPGQMQTVMFKPLSGLLNQPKYLPLRYMPLTLEFELVNNPLDPIVDPTTSSLGADGATQQFIAQTQTVAGNTSISWSILNVMVKCDMCTLDNALDNSYAQHLLSGKSLPINYDTWVSQFQTISGNQPTINITRALTRLKSVFMTLDKDISDFRNTFWRKQWNDFYSPASHNCGSGNMVFDANDEFEFTLQCGSKLFPEYPIRSHAEAFYQLQKSLGIQSSNLHNFNINGVQYRDNKLIIGIDMEKVIEAGWTGMNTRAGDLLTIKFKYDKDLNNSYFADRMHVVLHSDQILEIRDSGCAVFD